MSIQQIHQIFPSDAEWQEHCQTIEGAESFSRLIWTVLQAGLWFCRRIAQQELHRRAQVLTAWPAYANCGQRLQSKGFRERQMQTMIGLVQWKRRVGRCGNGCVGSHRVPLDEALGVMPHQAADEGLMRLGCVLSVMMPYNLAHWVLGQ